MAPGGDGQPVMDGAAAEVPGQQAEERPVARGPPPEHAQHERGEQRGIDEAEHQLQHVHDVVELRRHVGGQRC